MGAKRVDAEKVEAYTRALLEAARSEGRANADLVQWQHAQKFTPEVLETLAAMQKEDDLGLIEEVAKQYKELLDAHDTTVSVTVTTAVPMDDELRAKVRAKAEKDLQAPVPGDHRRHHARGARQALRRLRARPARQHPQDPLVYLHRRRGTINGNH